jgi:hypothetical protein
MIKKLRKEFLHNICTKLLTVDSQGIPNNADKSSTISIALSKGIVHEIGFEMIPKEKAAGQTSGKSFEIIIRDYIQKSFEYLQHLRAGKFEFSLGKSIHSFEQYEHLALLTDVLKSNRQLKATLGDYLICPDIVIGRYPEDDSEINKFKKLVGEKKYAALTPLRSLNSDKLILHASISCKWTIRSDRSQNARTEGLNLIRNRKGKTPHIVIVTAEPYPQRLASIALGTGDIDCVYHFALYELIESAKKLNNEAVLELLDTLVDGKRLRDISDLPFDLTI